MEAVLREEPCTEERAGLWARSRSIGSSQSGLR
jgi:hypothetical protein